MLQRARKSPSNVHHRESAELERDLAGWSIEITRRQASKSESKYNNNNNNNKSVLACFCWTRTNLKSILCGPIVSCWWAHVFLASSEHKAFGQSS